MSMEPLTIVIDHSGIATLHLNRPEVCNAFDDHLISTLTDTLNALAEDPKVKVVVLRGRGKHFSAGADLHWMRRMAKYSADENLQDAERLADLMHALKCLPQPSICVVQGAVMGGAVGLVCCSDIVLAADNSLFCLSEPKIGLSPAVISPFVMAAIGERQARWLMLTAQTIDAERAAELGLVHQVHTEAQLNDELITVLTQLMQLAPQALKKTKALIQHISQSPLAEAHRAYTTQLIADMRVSAEGQEGLTAFLEKRQPNWQKKG